MMTRSNITIRAARRIAVGAFRLPYGRDRAGNVCLVIEHGDGSQTCVDIVTTVDFVAEPVDLSGAQVRAVPALAAE